MCQGRGNIDGQAKWNVPIYEGKMIGRMRALYPAVPVFVETPTGRPGEDIAQDTIKAYDEIMTTIAEMRKDIIEIQRHVQLLKQELSKLQHTIT